MIMMAIRYKKFGNQEYAYEIWNEKKTEIKKWVQHSKYLGVVIDKEKGIYKKRNEIKQQSKKTEQKEQCILDYGDCYYFYEFLKNDEILPVLQSIFGKYLDTLSNIDMDIKEVVTRRYLQTINLQNKFFDQY